MNKKETISLYSLSNPLISTEWISVLGDKFIHSFPFNLKMVSDVSKADAIIWDGVFSPKSTKKYEEIIKELINGKLLVLHSDKRKVFANNPVVKQLDLENINYIEISGWTVLPEEILILISERFQKLKNV